MIGGERQMAEKKVGVVSHYYPKISVAIIKVSAAFKTGDMIKVSGKTPEFTQSVESMEFDHKKIEKAKKGDTIGMKVNEEVKKGDDVYLVS